LFTEAFEGRKMRKILKAIFVIVIVIQLSTLNIFFGYGQSVSKKENSPILPELYIDISSKFKEMGYTAENITSVSNDFINKVLLEYCKENPYGYETEQPPFYTTDNRYYFSGKNSVNEHAPQENSIIPKVEPKIGTLTESKACVTCIIWDHAGDLKDLPSIEDAAEYVYYYAPNYGDYDIVFTELENEVATKENLNDVLDYFFENYDNVDLYFMGHGTRIWLYYMGFWQWKAYYCPYDSIDSNGNLDSSKIFYDHELLSINPLWDSSPMRLVMTTSCWGYLFQNEALNPGGSISHDRAFAGKDGQGQAVYSKFYMYDWCRKWYYYDWDSSSAAASARDYAWSETEAGANMTYADTDGGIYC
jgi:hypothetical protein